MLTESTMRSERADDPPLRPLRIRSIPISPNRSITHTIRTSRTVTEGPVGDTERAAQNDGQRVRSRPPISTHMPVIFASGDQGCAGVSARRLTRPFRLRCSLVIAGLLPRRSSRGFPPIRAVSTEKKSHATAAWECRNCDHVISDRSGDGLMPLSLRIRQTVEEARRWPRPTSSPCMRWWPQVGFSAASRMMSWRISVAVEGRPGARVGWVQWWAMRRRCQRSKVSGVTSQPVRQARGAQRP